MRKIRVIMGAQSTGKTYLVKLLLKGLRSRYKKTLIIDIKGEYKIPGAVYFDNVRETIAALSLGHSDFTFILQRTRRDLEYIAFFLRNVKNIHLVVEEVRLTIPKKQIDAVSPDFKAESWLDIVSTLKEANIEATFIGQRPVDFPAAFLSQIDEIYSFRLSRADDVNDIINLFTPELDEIQGEDKLKEISDIMKARRLELLTAKRGQYLMRRLS